MRAKFQPTHGDAYPMEFFLGKVIVQANGKLFEVPYELDDTWEATLGKPTEVRIRFVPAETATEPTAEAVKEALAAATAPLSEEQKRARRLAGEPRGVDGLAPPGVPAGREPEVQVAEGGEVRAAGLAILQHAAQAGFLVWQGGAPPWPWPWPWRID